MAAAMAEESERVEPNLTPLLDVVMNLIMFFMITINFVNDQLNANVLLPDSVSAQELPPKTETDWLVINIEIERKDSIDPSTRKVKLDNHGNPIREVKTYPTRENPDKLQHKTRILIAGADPIEFLEDMEGTGIVKAQQELIKEARRRRAAIKLANRKYAGVPVEKVPLTEPVVIRADKETRYGIVIKLMGQCSAQGFSKIKFNVNRAAPQ